VNQIEGGRVRRREIIALIGGAAAWAFAVRAQATNVPKVGILPDESRSRSGGSMSFDRARRSWDDPMRSPQTW